MEEIGHYVIQYFYLKGLSSTNIKDELDSTLGESAPAFTIKYCTAEFKRGRTSCQDKHCSGQPHEATAPEMVKKIHKAVLNDH
ncbi:mariner transposase [Trichonephila clavipes]|nr:mariner transposase [Trichonephila clavipes]